MDGFYLRHRQDGTALAVVLWGGIRERLHSHATRVNFHFRDNRNK